MSEETKPQGDEQLDALLLGYARYKTRPNKGAVVAYHKAALAAKDTQIAELERMIDAYASDKREREDELASLRKETTAMEGLRLTDKKLLGYERKKATGHREDIARLRDLIRGWRGRALGAEGRLEALREAEGGGK